MLLTQIGVGTDVVAAGQGYVGLPRAVRAAEVGHRVVGCDVHPRRIKRHTAGDSYVEDVASSRPPERSARMPRARSRCTLGVWSMRRSWCTGSPRPAVGGL
ncbi:hypothetical protein [Streptomyces sp. CJ_13]|uniref:hypothetical protein n=1 Tax=Streptomyces sp. CJ_13 TaxID=2724943 RepID=UPI0035B21206